MTAAERTAQAAECQAAAERADHGDATPVAAGAAAASNEAGFRFHGFVIPAWATWFAPHPGEPLRDYRDRVLPVAQQAIAPLRAGVVQRRDAFAAAAHLRPQQLDQLDRTTQDTASALQERVFGAVMNGEVDPATLKPMTGVALARDLVDIVGRGNQQFLDSLDPGQRQTLDKGPFDFADYLVFSTRWEDALGML